MPVDFVTPGDGQEGSTMAEALAEPGNLGVAHTAMSNALANASGLANQGFAASADRRTSRADQLSGDSQAMWAVALTSPTVMAGLGIRTAQESGSGRTRAETNAPHETGAGGKVA